MPISNKSLSAAEEERKLEEERRQQALKTLAQFRPEVLKNKFDVNGRIYPLVTAEDLIQKEDKYLCSYCFLHAPHTPCGPQLGKYKECLNEKKDGKSPSEAMSESPENDPCKPIFENTFYPCLVQLSGSPYLYLRANSVFALGTRDLFKVWFDIQKYQAMNKIKN
ncbi:predicted protein [Naegleria gruberi]|uniref:Predicted protein n=1 Tax=Naegleria gruberi TaxID=5762 RepID=D2V816_NAEGR|nr:uncharacterized protein NAEGRDRAFT_64995 [Naegleria gruberi]EFC47100.1 predicted protein [Naegleria gruberi]|eukprot:XP_002679844.1 predicted protein [Naegleria gruberi strain NEG-M]